MSEPIKVGDLVMLVRGHECIFGRFGGMPYRVRTFTNQRGGGWRCPHCGERNIAPHETVGAVFDVIDDGSPWGLPVGWLKRIPPLSELDDVKLDEEITA